MAIIRNAANTLRKGRVGDTTYYVALGRQIARQRLNNSNYGKDARRTPSQQANRVRWSNLVNFYKVSRGWISKAFEYKRAGQTDYNRLMQVNVASSAISLTKTMAEAGACIADQYIISQGSLPSIEVTKSNNQWVTDLKLGELTIGAETTVADFTAALTLLNKHVRVGMQLTFVSYMQSVDGLGIPRLICTAYEVTLSDTDTSVLRDMLPDFASQTVNGALGTSDQIAVGAFAYILSDLSSGKLLISTQRLITFNADLISQYSSPENKQAAIDSYGVDDLVLLNPETTESQDATAKPVYIQAIKIQDRTFTSGSFVGNQNQYENDEVHIIMSFIPDGVKVTKASVNDQSGAIYWTTEPTISGNVITIPSMSQQYDIIITSVSVEMDNGMSYVINFPAKDPGSSVE